MVKPEVIVKMTIKQGTIHIKQHGVYVVPVKGHRSGSNNINSQNTCGTGV
jgi:hypothetical protein